MMEPKIRFKGFEGEWKTSTIGEIAPLQRGYDLPTNNVISGTIPVVYSNGILRFHNEGKCQAPAIITGRSGTIGKFTYIDHGEYWPHNTSLWVTTFHKNYPRFVYYFFQNVGFEKYATGSGVPTLNRNDIHKHIESIPSNKEEQQAIASYFTTLDSQISASTSRLASLKQMKAASLQAMFPQEGETVPKIRFKGFEGEWKKVMFSETFEFLKNNSLSRAELSNEGDIVNVHYGDVLIKYGDLLNIQNEELTFIADNKIGNTLYNSCHLQNGDIIIADAAEDNTVGKCSEIVNICNKRVVSGLHTIPCRPLNHFAQGYLGHYINSESYHNQLLPLIQGSKISSISKKTLSQTIVLVPSIEEQKCIGNYFTSLDRQISLQSQRLEKLKQIKSACLDKMFV